MSNVAFGMGGASLQGSKENTINRDTQKFAFKASYAEFNGEGRDVFKDPVTDPGKQSKKGLLDLVYSAEEETYKTVHGFREDSVMKVVYENGQLLNEENWETITSRLSSHVSKIKDLLKSISNKSHTLMFCNEDILSKIANFLGIIFEHQLTFEETLKECFAVLESHPELNLNILHLKYPKKAKKIQRYICGEEILDYRLKEKKSFSKWVVISTEKETREILLELVLDGEIVYYLQRELFLNKRDVDLQNAIDERIEKYKKLAKENNLYYKDLEFSPSPD
jgi:hypothetical protein